MKTEYTLWGVQLCKYREKKKKMKTEHEHTLFDVSPEKGVDLNVTIPMSIYAHATNEILMLANLLGLWCSKQFMYK